MYSDDDEAYYFSHHDYFYDTEDSEPYYDDDDYYDDYDEDYEYAARMFNKMAQMKAKADEASEVGPKVYHPKSLVDVCCKYLALNFPFAYLQDRFPPVPDDLQIKVITFSFPESEVQIRKYAEFSRPLTDLTLPSTMCNNGSVTNMMQIGFRLSANVDSQYVTIHFDRGKITLAHCSCGDSSGWCFHVIATALSRIRHVEKLDKSQLRLPVSDSLNTLSREQLLKFSQYLLYHHQNHKMVETAQGLIDKLVNRHGDYENEDINVVQGAPDPTAGPGLDEESHWFICDKGFKDKCNYINHETLDVLGFVTSENFDKNCQLNELWYKNRCQQPLVKDEIDTALGAEFFSYSRGHRQDSSNILETVLELLQDDSSSGLMAIKSCTEQVISRLGRRRPQRFLTPTPDVRNRSFYPSISPVMGFTVRPFRQWTLCDELSALWQVAVLNPKLKPKERQQVAQELLNWNQEVQTGCNVESLLPWKGLDIAYNLSQHVNWNTPEMQSVLHGRIPAYYSISGILLVEVKLEGQAFECHLPYCFTYGSITLDIQTWCAIIHTLDVFNYRHSAIKVAFCLSLALIGVYRYHADTRSHITDIPIVRRCSLQGRELQNSAMPRNKTNDKDTSKKATEKDTSSKTADKDVNMKPSEGVDEPSGECFCPDIWPADAMVSLRSFAFLYNVLCSNKSKAETLVAAQKQQDSLGTTEFGRVLSSVSSLESLVFQLGTIGLLLPKFPMSALKQEVEQFDLENWLSFQLLDMKLPTQNDIEFLSHLCKTIKNDGPVWVLAPCSSFTRVVLHHTYRQLSTIRVDVLELVLHNLEFSFAQDSQVCPWSLFEFSIAVSWCKLAELTLSIMVVDDSSHMERALYCLLNNSGILGQGDLKLRLSSEDTSNRHLLRHALNAKSRICFALAKALFARIKQSTANTNSHPSGHKCIPVMEILTGVTNRTLEVFPRVSCPTHVMALKKCAIRLGAHSVFLEKTSDRSYSYGSAVRWLVETSIECGLWGVRCLLSSHDDINDFLQHDEAINLCRMLMKKKDDSRISLVKEVLMSLLRQAVSTEAVDKIKDVLLVCREYNKNAYHILTPWVCEHLRDMARTKTIHYESLLVASEEVFKHYKDRLSQTIRENQKTCNLEGSYGLRQLFSEDSEEETEDLCKPSPPSNPYMMNHPHPYLELSFDLGIMGLNGLPKEDNAAFRRCHHRHESERMKKDHLKQLCDLVCYITNRKWLLQAPNEYVEVRSLPNSLGDSDESYLTRLVNDFLKLEISAMMLVTLLCEIALKLQVTEDTAQFDDNPILKQQLLRSVVKEVPHLRVMLERIESKFRNLLLGSKMDELVRSVTSHRQRPAKELRPDFEYHTLEDNTLRETLIAAKIIYGVSDPSGATFKRLAHEIEKVHKELKAVLDGILAGEEAPRRRDSEVFLNPFFLWPFISQEYVRRHPLEDFLN